MAEVSISLPILICGRDVSGKPFLERTRTLAIHSRGARVMSRQGLAAGDALQLSFANEDRECGAKVTWVGGKKGEYQEIGIEVDEQADGFWAGIYSATQCLQSPNKTPAPDIPGASEKLSHVLHELVEAALEESVGKAIADQFEARLRALGEARLKELEASLESKLADQESRATRQGQSLMREYLASVADSEARLTSYFRTRLAEIDARAGETQKRLSEISDARLADFDSRLTAAAERVWQDLGRRFTNAGLTYEKHISEVRAAREAEFEARLREILEKSLNELVKRVKEQ